MEDSNHRKKVFRKISRDEKRYDQEQRMLEKDISSDRAVMEEVFDRSTLMVIYDLLNEGIIDEVYGVVQAGKESRVYWAKDKREQELALKIYLTVSGEFRKGMLKYIEGDHRFKRVKRDTRSLIFTWAQKEFRNLSQASEAEVNVPNPVVVKKNVLVMEFIGERGVRAPSMKELSPQNPQETYHTLLTQVQRLYSKAELVHGDLSEYNIMLWEDEPVIFDLSQAVPLSHPLASQLLTRDLTNLNKYFRRQGIEVIPVKECIKRVTRNE
ncbi:MAG: serine protein kinase RIO [Thermoproteota archaeon]